MAEVWGWPGASGTRTVDSHVKALRAKIGADRVRTVHGVGYALEIAGAGRERPPLDPVRSVKVKLGVCWSARASRSPRWSRRSARRGGVPIWLSIPVTIALALAVTQLLAVGMTSPLREMTAAARRMATGDYAVRVTATSRDEVGELARAFNRMAEDLAAVDRQRRELVANVSHELRTPLAALCAVLENLVDGVAEPDPATLRAALDQGERMSALVTDLLDLSRVDAGGAPLAPRARRGPPAAGRRRRRGAGGRAGRRRTSFDVEPPDLVVDGDPARLRQLVANLLDNAVAAQPARRHRDGPGAGGGRRPLAARGRRRGPGRRAGDRDRAFERFGTLRTSRHRRRRRHRPRASPSPAG